MSDPIELSREEEQAAYFAISPLLGAVALNRQQPDYAVTPVVAAIVKAINKVRVGDPVGTIRRSEGGSVAVRVRRRESAWEVVVPGFVGGLIASSEVGDWPVIFSPEAM